MTLTLSLLTGGGTQAASWPPVESEEGAVAADHLLASQAGAEILAQGGNAVDAAVATALALGVVQPSASGLGGGGFLVVRLAGGKGGPTVRVLDFREVAPKKAHRDMFLNEKGEPVPERSRTSGLAVGVPGEPAGLGEALKTLGTMKPSQVIAPALRLAKEGFPAGRHLARTAGWVLERGLSEDHPLRPLLSPSGKQLVAGQKVRRPELASTLEILSQEGFSAFYKTGPGSLGEQIVGAVQKKGGVLANEDLTTYKPIWREPLRGTYKDYQIFSVPPPGGGLTTLEALQVIAARSPLSEGPVASATLHIQAEAFKHAFADRIRLLSDPAFVKVPVAELASPAYAARLAARIQEDKVLAKAAYGYMGGGGPAPKDKGTTHLCVIDRHGNVAALTTTVNLAFGSKIVAGKSGILLNNQMDDFSSKPGAPNAFGIVGSEANSVAPGKRPLSSMSPTVAVGPDGTLVCAGGSGGPTIVTGTVQALVNVMEFKMDAQAAVSAPRIHAQLEPEHLSVEKEVPKDVQDALTKKGHKIRIASGSGEGAVQVVVRLPGKGTGKPLVAGGSDPRKLGQPATPPSP